jgi:D-alanine--poly(phosphoribitol) ligase subunit 1
LIKKFYKKIFQNLSSNELFFRYNQIEYSYKDLGHKYNLFYNFTKKYGLKKKRICVISEKSFDSYSLAISIILTNNTWVPLSNKLPIDRLFKMIKSVNPEIIITDDKSIKKKFLQLNIRIILTAEINSQKLKEKSKLELSHQPSDLAMIFFTSGSTGEPKGVPITNSNFLPSLFSQIDQFYKKKKHLVFVDFHDLSFVISLNILIPCVFLKSTIVPAIKNFDIIFPHEHIIKNKVNVLISVPSFINQIRSILNLKKKFFMNFKIVIMCGETFHINILDFILKKFPRSAIYNCYGSTELSPWVFSYRFQKKDLIMIRKLKLVPIGKKFEFVKFNINQRNNLLISGPSVVSGYLDKKFNLEKFIKINKSLWYKTGDIASKKNDLVFIKGRDDNQIKIHGYRVDLLDIESTLRLNKDVVNTYIHIRNKDSYNKQIIAVVETLKKIKEKKIFEFLKKRLPIYMLPKQIIFVKKFPKNKNGKIDRVKIANLINS